MNFCFRHIIIVLFVVLFAGCTPKTDIQSQHMYSLHNNWLFREEGSLKWQNAKVPGTVHLDLLANGFIEDPYYRTNDKEQQWIGETNWEYEKTFDIDKNLLAFDNIDLIFEGLDTYAEVYINNSLIGQTNNMFLEYRFNCKEYLKNGKNNLRVKFISPITKTKKLKANIPYPLVAKMEPVPENEKLSMLSRKAPFHFGWDWGPRLITCGIWRPVYFNAWNDAKIEDFYIRQDSVSGEKAWLTAYIEINSNDKHENVYVDLILDENIAVNKRVNLSTGLNNISIPVTIDSPQLWWPNGMGEQKLYKISARIKFNSFVIDTVSEQIGIRTIKVKHEKDSIGESFFFEVNGVPVFMKGANYVPMDNFTPRVSAERYNTLLESVVDANMNMLRIWGGGIYENKIFYDLCDQKGILLWHDFMFACAFYPNTDAFTDNVKEEVIYNIKRLRNHPSIALWCGNNEVKMYLNEREEEKDEFPEVWKAYDKIFYDIIPEQIKILSPNIDYWPSSPTTDYFDEKEDKWASGNMHYWGVWHNKELFNNFLKQKNTGRFMTEFGFQSYPNMETVNYYTVPKDHYIESEVMLSHQRNSWGNGIMEHYMKEEYKLPKDFPSFLYSSQILQANAMKVAVEHHRRKKPFTMGSIYWQLNDCWPVASWSSIDYFGRWKASHFFAKNFFKPLLVSPFEEDGFVKIQIISDERDANKGILEIRLYNILGKVLYSKDMVIKVDPFSSKTYFKINREKLLFRYNTNDVFLSTDFIVSGKMKSSNEYFFSKMKDFKLSTPHFKTAVLDDEKGIRIFLNTNVLAKNICLDINNFTGRFSDNYFDLIPGKEKEILFVSDEVINPRQFKNKLKIMSLIDTY